MALIRTESDVKADIKRLNHRLHIYHLSEMLNMQQYVAINGFYFMPVQSGFGVSGIHDFVMCIRGRFVTVETKAQNSGRLPKASRLQELFAEATTRASGLTFLIDNVDDWEQCLRTHFPELFPGG
jgi:hypothetical protein